MINEEIWQKLKLFYTEFPSIKFTNVSDSEICQAEDVLNLRFSDFYRYFLKTHKVSSIGNMNLKALNHNTLSDLSVIDSTIKFKQDKMHLGCENYYIISKNENDQLIAASPMGRIYKINPANENKEKIADNFEEFIHQLLLDANIF